MDFLVVEINYTIIFSIHPMHERGCQLFRTGLGQDFCPMIANLFQDDKLSWNIYPKCGTQGFSLLQKNTELGRRY